MKGLAGFEPAASILAAPCRPRIVLVPEVPFFVYCPGLWPGAPSLLSGGLVGVCMCSTTASTHPIAQHEAEHFLPHQWQVRLVTGPVINASMNDLCVDLLPAANNSP